MRELFEANRSRRNRGGSLAVAAAHITHLLRYTWARRVDPIDLTDSVFREFIKELRADVHVLDPSRKKRSTNSVIAIARTCLAFLNSVAKQAGDARLLGPEGRIRAVLQRDVTPVERDTRRRYVATSYWQHSAIPYPDPQKKRMPISTPSMEALRKAVGQISGSSHQRARRHAMLKLLEVTGARRGEVALITVSSLRKAAAMEHPMLKIPTLKKRGDREPHRYVPITHADLHFLLQYANVHRNSVVRRKLTAAHDHGILLVSGVTGEPLQWNTITQEVRVLAKAAGIRERACPHMFRHRFLTKLFVALIEQHAIQNADDFRRLLLDGEELKRKVVEWTDHTNLETLDRYIDLAFDEIGQFKKVYSLVFVGIAIDSFMGTIDAELQAVDSGEQPMLILERLRGHLEQLKVDLTRAKDSSADSGSGSDDEF